MLSHMLDLRHTCCTKNIGRRVQPERQLITPLHFCKVRNTYTSSHTMSMPAGAETSRGDRSVKTTYWLGFFCCGVSLFLSAKKNKKNPHTHTYMHTHTQSDLPRVSLMHFSRVPSKTPCSSTLKSNFVLPGLKVHVKLKATLCKNMKN